MLPKIFYRNRFRKLAATYGARIDLWPAHDQPHARSFMKRCPSKAADDLAAARHVDSWLEACAPAPVSEDSQWRAFGALTNARSTFALSTEAAETVAETLIFAPEPKAAEPASKEQSLASLEIREERARMIAKGRKTFGKGILKFQ